MIGGNFEERDDCIREIARYCKLYFDGDCANAIALERIKELIEALK